MQSKKGSRTRSTTAEETLFLSLLRTGDLLLGEVSAVLKPAGLSLTQFNVLHILRGAGEEGLPSGEIGQRMITRDPDLTRLLDRLEARKLVERRRCDTDRRRVYNTVTETGLELIGQYDRPVQARLAQLLAPLGNEKLSRLTELLADARALATATCSGADDARGRENNDSARGGR
jgi:DNA-binding MarR family transcriptional regulator